MSQNAKEILDTMLGYLGFVCDIKEYERDGVPTLQIYTAEHERLGGPHGELIEEIQLLLNRVLSAKDKNAPRVNVDVEHFREMREDALLQRVRQIAEVVRKTGRPMQLEPMNAYERRIVHNAFKDDPEVATWSPREEARMKRITLKRRTPAAQPAKA